MASRSDMARTPARKSVQSRKPARIEVSVSWDAIANLPVQAANVFMLQVAPTEGGKPGEIVLGVGFLPPPPVAGTPEQRIAQIEKLDRVPVQPVARLAFSGDRA